MRRIIYISQATIGDDNAAIEAIVLESVAWNSSLGVTGMLWFDGTRFAQVLEGDHDPVGLTMDRIARDRRHRDVEIILDREIANRMFATWAMMRADDSESATISTSFLVGFARSLHSEAGRRLYEIAIASYG